MLDIISPSINLSSQLSACIEEKKILAANYSTLLTILEAILDQVQHTGIQAKKELIALIQELITSQEGSYITEHLRQVEKTSTHLAKLFGVAEYLIPKISLTSRLQDLGMVGLPPYLTANTGKITIAEKDQIEQHPYFSVDVLSRSSYIDDDMKLMILQHHEHWDGSGYPNSIAGSKIHIVARINSISDTYVAMTSQRLYRDAVSPGDAFHEILINAGTKFDPYLCKVLLINYYVHIQEQSTSKNDTQANLLADLLKQICKKYCKVLGLVPSGPSIMDDLNKILDPSKSPQSTLFDDTSISTLFGNPQQK